MEKSLRELLLKDLCARLSYEVIVKYKSREKEGNVKITSGNIGYVAELGNGWWKECKPYLRPMSSMTDEEKKEYDETFDCIVSTRGVEINHERRPTYETYDWLNEHYFDYRELIEKGLALEAPENMYNIK